MFDFLSTPQFQQAVASVVISVLGILATAITGIIAGFVRSKASAQQLSTLENIARIAVLAAEQSGFAGLIEDKKQAALDAASAMLASRGIKVSAEELDAAIESAVAEELNRPAINEAGYAKALAVSSATRAAATTTPAPGEEPAAA